MSVASRKSEIGSFATLVRQRRRIISTGRHIVLVSVAGATEYSMAPNYFLVVGSAEDFEGRGDQVPEIILEELDQLRSGRD